MIDATRSRGWRYRNLVCFFFVAFCGEISLWTSSHIFASAASCSSLDSLGYLFDFSSLVGHEATHPVTGGGNFVIEFCSRAYYSTTAEGSSLIVSFGQFSAVSHFGPSLLPPFHPSTFTQTYIDGDVSGCTSSGGDALGRSSEVSLRCNLCPDGTSCATNTTQKACICKTDLASSSSSSSQCLVKVDMMVVCPLPVRHVFEGLSVGFSLQDTEIVKDGVPQWGYEGTNHVDYSFETDQHEVSFYFSAPVATGPLHKIVTVKVEPSMGLSVDAKGDAAQGVIGTVEDPTLLSLSWRCNQIRNAPYVVNVTVEAPGLSPTTFFLLKNCDSVQLMPETVSWAWATFGAWIFLFTLLLCCTCCGTFCYRVVVYEQHGMDAVPGADLMHHLLEKSSYIVITHVSPAAAKAGIPRGVAAPAPEAADEDGTADEEATAGGGGEDRAQQPNGMTDLEAAASVVAPAEAVESGEWPEALKPAGVGTIPRTTPT
eukprot:TRINITY_DN6951_c0_g1_i1.p1 TRINITY_DN6951_c0_g1~~TRINITY_DN6951_c0_g1_i1.p1  ORF type:complete len:484 (+),score=87.34 TRINITY_DN6951_c0_g1_i1:176-1627(+)